MADFSAFRPYVLPEVPGCPQVMVDDAIKVACRQFSEDTWLVTHDVPTFNTVVGTQSYTLTPPSQHEIFAVSAVVKDGQKPELSPTTESAVERYAVSDGPPSAFWFKSPKLWLNTAPDAVSPLLVEAVIRPLQSAATVDDQFLEFREAIACFAKSKLMAMPGKTWYSPSDSNSNYIAYVQLSSVQRRKKNSGRVAAPLRAVASFF